MDNRQDKEGLCALSIIQRIKDGQFDPKLLDKEMRQQCVEVFMGEGYSKAQMAQIFKCSEKTIKRDTEEILLHNSLVPDDNLRKKIVSQLTMIVAAVREHLMRLSGKPDTSVAERTQAGYMAFKVFAEYIEKLQSLGYLPSSPRAIAGDISLHIDGQEEQSFDDLKTQVIQVEKVIAETGDIPDKDKEEIVKIKELIDKAQITYQIQKFTLNKKEDSNEPDNHE